MVFWADSQHQEITNIYMRLVVHRVESRMYTPDQILDFVKEIEGNLWVVCNALAAGGDPSKRHAFCLFISNFGGAMGIPTDPPYCLVYPTCYVRDADLDHFDTHNSPVGMCLHHCICHTTLQFSNDDPREQTNYSRSCLILPCRAQYNEWLFQSILELWTTVARLLIL